MSENPQWSAAYGVISYFRSVNSPLSPQTEQLMEPRDWRVINQVMEEFKISYENHLNKREPLEYFEYEFVKEGFDDKIIGFFYRHLVDQSKPVYPEAVRLVDNRLYHVYNSKFEGFETHVVEESTDEGWKIRQIRLKVKKNRLE